MEKKSNEIFDITQMKDSLRQKALELGLENTLKALEYAGVAHEGQTRKGSEIPYIYHPLCLACHALAMGISHDEILAACLLHDVVEDCGVALTDLPVDAETKELVRLLTCEKTDDENRESILNAYYKAIASNPKASLCKCIDRCNNLTSMSWGLTTDRKQRMIRETKLYYPALFEAVLGMPEFKDAVWLLKYQIESMIDIYERMI